MNKGQQKVISIMIPLLAVILGYAYITAMTTIGYNGMSFPVDWNDFELTWGVWLIVVATIGIAEFILLGKGVKK